MEKKYCEARNILDFSSTQQGFGLQTMQWRSHRDSSKNNKPPVSAALCTKREILASFYKAAETFWSFIRTYFSEESSSEEESSFWRKNIIIIRLLIVIWYTTGSETSAPQFLLKWDSQTNSFPSFFDMLKGKYRGNKVSCIHLQMHRNMRQEKVNIK